MRYVNKVLLVWFGILLTAGVAAGPALAYRDSCGIRDAKRDVAAAKRAVRRANARLGEARYVLRQTKTATAQYGTNVGRWVRLARRVGWSRGCISHLMYVINRESGGSPKAKNPTSSASGLLQFMSGWWTGQWGYPAFDPFDPRANLKAGVWVYRHEGWQPWSL